MLHFLFQIKTDRRTNRCCRKDRKKLFILETNKFAKEHVCSIVKCSFSTLSDVIPTTTSTTTSTSTVTFKSSFKRVMSLAFPYSISPTKIAQWKSERVWAKVKSGSKRRRRLNKNNHLFDTRGGLWRGVRKHFFVLRGWVRHLHLFPSGTLIFFSAF